jgi:hypothetical protein
MQGMRHSRESGISSISTDTRAPTIHASPSHSAASPISRAQSAGSANSRAPTPEGKSDVPKHLSRGPQNSQSRDLYISPRGVRVPTSVAASKGIIVTPRTPLSTSYGVRPPVEETVVAHFVRPARDAALDISIGSGKIVYEDAPFRLATTLLVLLLGVNFPSARHLMQTGILPASVENKSK